MLRAYRSLCLATDLRRQTARDHRYRTRDELRRDTKRLSTSLRVQDTESVPRKDSIAHRSFGGVLAEVEQLEPDPDAFLDHSTASESRARNR